MGGLSLGTRPPQGYAQQPPSNTGLPQSNFPTRSMVAGPPNHPQMTGPPRQMMGPPPVSQPYQMQTGSMPPPNQAPQMMGPPGQMTGPPGQMMGPPPVSQPYQMQTGSPASMPPPNQAPQMMGPPGQMMGPPGQMMGPPGAQQIRAPVSHHPGHLTGPPTSMMTGTHVIPLSVCEISLDSRPH